MSAVEAERRKPAHTLWLWACQPFPPMHLYLPNVNYRETIIIFVFAYTQGTAAYRQPWAC